MTNNTNEIKFNLDDLPFSTEGLTSETQTQLVTPSPENVSSNMVLVSVDENFRTFYNQETKKFTRKQVYHDFSSVIAETKKEKMALLQLTENATSMRNALNHEIKLGGVIIKPYSTLNEDTGELDFGATTTIFNADFTKAYVTSSKVFYSKIKECIEMFGAELFTPGDEVTIIISTYKGSSNDGITFTYA